MFKVHLLNIFINIHTHDVNMQAYTYSIFHIPSKRYYYGVRKSNEIDIGKTYFSSSKLIKRMLREEPMSNFEFKIRRKFETYEDARKHETKMLRRLDAIHNVRLLNQAISSPRICSKDSVSEIKRRKSISSTMKSKWSNEEYKNSHPFLKLTTEERSQRGKITANKRKEDYASGRKKYKKRIKKYKDVVIFRDNDQKIIKSNQVPAYRKLGWALKGV